MKRRVVVGARSDGRMVAGLLSLERRHEEVEAALFNASEAIANGGTVWLFVKVGVGLLY